MPPLWPYLLLLVPAAPLVYTDFRMRCVSVWSLAVLCGAAVAVGWISFGFRPMLLHAGVNAGILVIFSAAMLGYQLLRHRPVRTFFEQSFGLGDIVMMIAVVPLFVPGSYVRFLLVSCLAALAWWMVKRTETIPFAGIMAFVLGVYVLCKTFGLWN